MPRARKRRRHRRAARQSIADRRLSIRGAVRHGRRGGTRPTLGSEWTSWTGADDDAIDTPDRQSPREAIFNRSRGLQDVIVRTGSPSRSTPVTAWLMEAGEMGYEIPLLLDVFLGTTVDNVNSAPRAARRAMWRAVLHSDAPRWSCPTMPRRADDPARAVVLRDVRSIDGAPCPAQCSTLAGQRAGCVSHFRPRTCPSTTCRRLTADRRAASSSRPWSLDYRSPIRVTGQLVARWAEPPGGPHTSTSKSAPGCRPLTTQVTSTVTPGSTGHRGAVKDRCDHVLPTTSR